MTKEKEGDIEVYEIEFIQEGRNFEADIKEDGLIHDWEKAIELNYLPGAVYKAIESRYPNSTIDENMGVTVVIHGMDTLEGYESILQTADKQGIEIMVIPAGIILEDSGEKNGE